MNFRRKGVYGQNLSIRLCIVSALVETVPDWFFLNYISCRDNIYFA